MGVLNVQRCKYPNHGLASGTASIKKTEDSIKDTAIINSGFLANFGNIPTNFTLFSSFPSF
jgi:hypothetical protein